MILIVAMVWLLAAVPTRVLGGVTALDDGNFDEQPGLAVSTEGEWIVDFHAPWCGQCKLLQPVWEQLGAVLPTSGVRVGSVDCTLNPELQDEHKIDAYPTILFFRDGKQIAQYQSADRSLKALLEWVQARRRSPLDAQHLQRLLTVNGAAPATPAAAAATKSASGSDKTSAPAATAPADDELPSPRSAVGTVYRLFRDRARAFIANPTKVISDYPLGCVAVAYLIGLMHGGFVGVVWALRERNLMAERVP